MKKPVFIILLILLLTSVVSVISEESASTPATFEDHADRFLAAGSTPIISEMSYQSENLSIEIRLEREDRSDVYIADIWLRDLSLLRRGFGGGKYRTKMQKVSTIAQNENAIIALNEVIPDILSEKESSLQTAN